MKRITALILCVLMLLPTLIGCEINFTPKEDVPANGEQTENKNEKPSDNGTISLGTSGGNETAPNINVSESESVDEDGTDWATYDWDNFNIADFIEPLGDATFTVDSASSTTGKFLADDETPLSLSVTDAAGAVWTLDIHAHALLSPETITMTVLRDVKLGGEDLDGGVLLSPDSLFFIEPATLTVTGNNCGGDSVIFEGEHDGKNMTFTEYETGDGSVSATIWHFSTRVKGNGKGSGVSEHYLSILVDMGNEILKRSLEAPEPPSITFKCPASHNADSNSKNEAIKSFMYKCIDPEIEAIEALNKAIANYKGQDIILAQAMDMVMKLKKRFADKVNMLIYKYKGQEDKFAAICWLAVYGGWVINDDNDIDFMEAKQYFIETWNEFMRDLVERHDYTRAHSLTILKNVYKNILAFRNVNLDTAVLDKKLSNALTFGLVWDLEMHVYFTISSSGEVKVSMELKEQSEFFGEGIGEGRVFKFYDPEGSVYVPSFPTFSNRAQISKFNPCMNNNITVGIDKCGTDFTAMARTEQGDYPVPFTDYPEPLIGYTTGDYNYSTGFYEFELVLNNFSEKCAEINIPQQVEELRHTLELTIIHTPKDDVFLK